MSIPNKTNDRDDHSWCAVHFVIQLCQDCLNKTGKKPCDCSAFCAHCQQLGLPAKRYPYGSAHSKDNAWKHVRNRHAQLKPANWGTLNQRIVASPKAFWPPSELSIDCVPVPPVFITLSTPH